MPKLKNLDAHNEKTKDLFMAVATAENEEDFIKAQIEVANHLQEEIIAEAKQFIENGINDNEVLNKRGLAVLTSEERKYYNEVQSKGGFSGIEKLMPVTIIDRIFKDIENEHPLLEKIQFVNTTGITRWVARKSDAQGAVWGKVGEEIKKKLDGSFEVVDTTLHKLSAFIPVSKDMLKLAPEWLDKYVRILLSESLAIGLEKAVIDGNGLNCPVGLLKNITGDLNSVSGYPDTNAAVLKDFSPESLGKLVMKPLVDGKVKTISKILLVCNPGDYWAKIFPQTTTKSANGHYEFNVLPINAEVVQSAFVPENKLIAFIPQDYFLGIGFNGPVEYSDHVNFLEDERIYIQKLLGNGKIINPKSVLVFNIESMTVPAV